MFVPAVMIAVGVMVPVVVMFETAVRADPVAGIVAMAVMVGKNPACARVGWTGPVTRVPAIVVADWIPVTLNPYEFGPWSHCANYDTRRRRRSDLDADADLSSGAMR